MKPFKQEFTFEKRKTEAERILTKYPDRLPIIVETSGKTALHLDKHKFLVPKDLTIGQFSYVLRKRIKLTPEKAMFLFIGNNICTASTLMINAYNESKDADLFLYVTICEESTFG